MSVIEKSRELLIAINARDSKRVASLLEEGVCPNSFAEIETYLGPVRPLEVALSEVEDGGPLTVVRMLINAGADVNAWDSDCEYTPIHVVSRLDSARLLLENNADVNRKSSFGELPLVCASSEGDYELVKLFLEFGATKAINEEGFPQYVSALTCAAQNLDVSMVELLLNNGADPGTRDADGDSVYDYLERREDTAEAYQQILRLLKRFEKE